MDNQNLKIDSQSYQHLQLAFEQFNRLSASLCSCFDNLNHTADHLTRPASCADRGVKKSANRQLAFRLRALIDAIPGSVVVLDPQGIVVEFNSTALELLGEPLQQQLWRDIVQRMFLANLDQGELKTEDGRQFSISTKPLGYEPGQILLLSDVTQTRQLQRAAQQNLHLMTMGKMMASLAHQIRTPLASSMLYLSQIVESALDSEANLSFSEKALGQIRHIEKMINDMLVFAHGGNFNMSRFSITELLDDLEQQIRPQIDRRSAKLAISGLNISGTNKDLQLQGNRDALLGALGNLCMNSLDANETSPHIKIKVSLSERGLLSVIIDDNGCGMDRHTRAHLFDPFFSTKIDGTGLGLAVVKSVIESHQGSITLASRPAKGSRFRILLPCRQAVKTQLSHKGHNNR